jgi:hypothetical protein
MEVINVMSYNVKLKKFIKRTKVLLMNNRIKVVDKYDEKYATYYPFSNNFGNLKEGFVSVLYKVDGVIYLKDVWFTPNITKTDDWYKSFQHPLNVSCGRKSVDIIKDILKHEVEKIDRCIKNKI